MIISPSVSSYGSPLTKIHGVAALEVDENSRHESLSLESVSERVSEMVILSLFEHSSLLLNRPALHVIPNTKRRSHAAN